MTTKARALKPNRCSPIQSGVLQRKCACGGSVGHGAECDKCRKKRQGILQRQTAGPEPDDVPPIVHEVLRSPGQPLDSAARVFMESRIGHDFSHVRVHTGTRATESARSVQALAYTAGSHIVFGDGRYEPHRPDGLRLLAHELTHVVQQGHGGPVRVQRQRNDGVEEEFEAETRRFRRARREELGRIIEGMRFRKVIADCAENTGVHLTDVLASTAARVRGNRPCLEFFRRQFNVDPIPLFDLGRDPTFTVVPSMRGSGVTRCPRPSIKLRGDVCTSPLRERVVMHELTHYAGCLTPTHRPCSEELARRGEDLCIGTVSEVLERHRAAQHAEFGPSASPPPAQPTVPREELQRCAEPSDRMHLGIAARGDDAEREAEAVAASLDLASVTAPEPSVQRVSALGPSGHEFGHVRLHAVHSMVQRQAEGGSQSRPPLIPIPVFEELDPMVIVPDVPGVPSILRGQMIKLSDLRSALEIFQGGLPRLSTGSGKDICATLIPGYEQVRTGSLAGLCCPRFVRDRDRCCRPQQIAPLDFRCCKPAEVVISGRCVRPRPAPTPTPTPVTPEPEVPAVRRFELRLRPIRFGTIRSQTIDHFGVDRSTVPAGAADSLDHLANLIRLYPDAEVHIEGHTDSSFTPEHNQTLAEYRAQAVRAALVSRGVDPARIVEVTGHGEEELRFPEERTEEEKASNRRVEVWFYTPPTEGLAERLRLGPAPSPPFPWLNTYP